MSALNAIEMSAFLWAIEQSFLPWARRTSGYRQRGKRTDRDESSRAGSVESLVRCNPEGTVAEGGSSIVAAHYPSSTSAGPTNKRLGRSRTHSPPARASFQSRLAGRVAAAGAGRIPTLLLGIRPYLGQ